MSNFVKRFKKSLLDMSPILTKFTPPFKESLLNFNPYASNTLPRKGRSAHSPQLTSLHTSLPHFPPPNQIGPIPSSNFLFSKISGDDPVGWIYKTEQYFDFQNIASEQEVQFVYFHLEGITLQRHRWLTKFKGPHIWTEFTKTILLRFGPTDYEDPSKL